MISSDSAGARETIGSFVKSSLRVIGTVLSVHLWLALNIMLAIHPFLALVYALFPPIAVIWAADLVVRFAAFSLLAAGVFFLSVTTIWIVFGRRIVDAPAIAYVFYLPFFAIWLPVGSGEAVRAVGMHSALIAASPDCYETSSFIASLHDHGEHAQAHAWMVKDGKRYIWSYSELRFVADSRPWLSGGSCR